MPAIAKATDPIEEIARIARELGFHAMISDSNTTESSYVSIGVRSANGGFAQCLNVRVSGHRKPGFRSGWHNLAKADVKAGRTPTYHAKLRSATERNVVEVATEFLKAADSRPFYGCSRIDHSKIAPKYRVGLPW